MIEYLQFQYPSENMDLSIVILFDLFFRSKDCNNDGMINCSNGICISKNATCDGFNDCLDFSDEDYCRKYLNQMCVFIVMFCAIISFVVQFLIGKFT